MRALLLVFVLSCGSNHTPKTHQIEIRSMQFSPAQLAVDVGDTITWTNHDVLPHTVTSGIPSPTSFDSKEIAAKATWSMTVSASGDYSYGCTYHPTMHGTVTVR